MRPPPRDKGKHLTRLPSSLPRAELHPEHLEEWRGWLQHVSPLTKRHDRDSRIQRLEAFLAAEQPPQPLPLGDMAESLRPREAGRRIDLHGMTLQQAYLALGEFVRRRQAAGLREVWVITGKGQDGQGVLRHEVPKWLKLWPECVRHVSVASHRDGGAGAFKVTLVKLSGRGGRHG